MSDLSHYAVLAGVFDYPGPGIREITANLEGIVRKRLPGMIHLLQAFADHVKAKPLAALQEYYIATFDVQALCFLDIGYVLYGEDYQRGVFLVHMKQEQEQAGNECGSELPDHLPNMLRLLPRLRDELLAEELVYSLMIPALEKMTGSFHSADNVYKDLLRLLLAMMEHDYPESSFERFDFRARKKGESFRCLPNGEIMHEHIHSKI